MSKTVFPFLASLSNELPAIAGDKARSCVFVRLWPHHNKKEHLYAGITFYTDEKFYGADAPVTGL